ITSASAPIIPEKSNAVPLQPTVPEKSIAVLPFLDLSQAKDQEYFCDGISEEILDALAKVEGLRVVARTSSFSFKGRSVDVSDVRKKLNVENVLEGRLRRGFAEGARFVSAGSRQRSEIFACLDWDRESLVFFSGRLRKTARSLPSIKSGSVEGDCARRERCSGTLLPWLGETSPRLGPGG